MGETVDIDWPEAQKEAARQVVNREIYLGIRPDPNKLPCADCGHVWHDGERRHEYHHFAGYSEDQFSLVVSLCTCCHYGRHHQPVIHCKHGHEYNDQNTHFRKNGTRECKTCRNIQKKLKRTAAWWRQRRLRLKGKSDGAENEYKLD